MWFAERHDHSLQTKMLHNGDKKWAGIWLRRALTGHVISCACAILLNLYQAIKNYRRLVHIQHCVDLHEKCISESMNTSEHEKISRKLKYYHDLVNIH